jgi:hypothetical protein
LNQVGDNPWIGATWSGCFSSLDIASFADVALSKPLGRRLNQLHDHAAEMDRRHIASRAAAVVLPAIS